MEIETITTLTRIITAMITPVILILATSSILGITSQRLSKSLERVRKMWEMIVRFPSMEDNKEFEKSAKLNLISLIKKASRRARLLQKTMTILYISLCLFVGTSVAIGLIELFDTNIYWIPMTLEISGIGLLFYSTIILILETHIALSAVNEETSYVLDVERLIKF